MKNINYGIFIGQIINILNKKESNKYNKSINDRYNNNNYIIAEIFINIEDIDKDIRIINSYENVKREMFLMVSDFYNENEKEIKENCEIKINNILFPFSYFFKFKISGKYIIKYSFKNLIIYSMIANP